MSAARFFRVLAKSKTAVGARLWELHARGWRANRLQKFARNACGSAEDFRRQSEAASANATNASMQKYRLHQMTYRRFRRSGNATCLRSLGFMASRS